MGYLNQYVQRYKTCTVQIDTTEGFVLELTFDEMSIRSCSTCSCGHVKGKDGSTSYAPTVGIYCNGNYPNLVSSTGTHMRIEHYVYR